MKIEHLGIGELHQDPSNARRHSNKNLDAIKASLTKFGQQKPIVINSQNIVIAGNGTLLAARELEWTSLNCVRSTLGNVEQVGYAISDNRTTDLSDWDTDVLGNTLQSLREDDWDLGELGFDDIDQGKFLGDSVEPVDIDFDLNSDKDFDLLDIPKDLKARLLKQLKNRSPDHWLKIVEMLESA